jgi:phosphoribosyl 1,2-cyclic phosphodiesterase
MNAASSGDLIVSSLGSGSNGNAFLVEHGTIRILVDAGVPIRTLTTCLTHRSLGPSDLTAALVSHEHVDHVRSIPQLLRKSRLSVFATRGTHAGISGILDSERHVVCALEQFQIGDLAVTPIPVAHDAREPVGYFIESASASVAIMTDLGEASEINAEFAARADHLIVESNFDEAMLRTGPYPAHLKKRIRSSDGHLSNEECAELLRDINGGRTGEIWLSHLSENNNRPDLAIAASTQSLKTTGIVRTITALPRYDGTILTWHSSQKRSTVSQSQLPFGPG